MNKGLEVIEATLIVFELPESQVNVVVHPQSLVHSLVEYADGSLLAQLGAPDMRTHMIAQALAWPETGAFRCTIARLGSNRTLGFRTSRSRTLSRVLDSRQGRLLLAGGTAPAVLNAAE